MRKATWFLALGLTMALSALGLWAEGNVELLKSGFEGGDLGGWTIRGNPETDPMSIKVVSTEKKSGGGSLMVSNRSKSWQAPMRRLDEAYEGGTMYKVSGYIKYLDGPDTVVFILSNEFGYKDPKVDHSYKNVAKVNVKKGEWTLVEGEFSTPGDPTLKDLWFYFETDAAEKLEYYVDEVSLVKLDMGAKIQEEIPSLRDVFSDYFTLGAAVMSDQVAKKNPNFPLITKHFSSLVAGNEMKPEALEPREGDFKWANADAIVELAEKTGMRMRGHTLCWHSQTPNWFFQDKDDPSKPASKEVALKRLETYIKTVVGHFKGSVASWDVVNEVITDGGDYRTQDQNSKWYAICGPEYIEKAFIWAHEADPDAELVINDYNLESSPRKRQFMYTLVKELLAKKVPVHAVGLQMHISNYGPSVDDIRQTIELFSSLGLKVIITEMDMSIYNGGEAFKEASPLVLQTQAKRYKDIFAVFKDQAKKGNIKDVVLWGTSDADTWLDNHPVVGRRDAPLLFDRKLQAKPAYWAIVDPSTVPVEALELRAPSVAKAPKGIGDKAWNDVAIIPYKDEAGNVVAKLRLCWDAANVYALVEVSDSKKDKEDSIAFYFDPNNSHSKSDVNGVAIEKASRGKKTKAIGFKEVKGGYLAMASFPIDPKKNYMGKKFAFDVRIQNAKDQISLSDTHHSQDLSSESYAECTMVKATNTASVGLGTVKIDGEKDAIWDKVASIQTKTVTMGKAGAEASFKLLWDQKFLYVWAEVSDPVLSDASGNAHEQDSVEVFIDQNNAKSGNYQADDAQYRVNFKNKQSFGGNPDRGFKSFAKVQGGGYLVEMAIPLSTIDPAEGITIGFDLQVNDCDDKGRRVAIRNWCDNTNNGWQSTSGFGVLNLKK